MRVAASTTVGEGALSEENDIFVRTPEDGKHIFHTGFIMGFDFSDWWYISTENSE